jgi:hypothetical protein
MSAAGLNTDASIVFKSAASVGVIPFLVGIAFFIIHFMEKKKSGSENARIQN